MRADDRCAGRTPSHCAAARAAPTLNLKRGGGGRVRRGEPSINSAQAPAALSAPLPARSMPVGEGALNCSTKVKIRISLSPLTKCTFLRFHVARTASSARSGVEAGERCRNRPRPSTCLASAHPHLHNRSPREIGSGRHAPHLAARSASTRHRADDLPMLIAYTSPAAHALNTHLAARSSIA
ncbi:unnamed protein product, partial [Iphiclides podalirius]